MEGAAREQPGCLSAERGDDLPGLDADPHLELLSGAGGELGLQRREAIEHRERRADRALGVVFVRNRGAEHGDHAVSRVLLGRAAEPLDLLRHRLEEGRHDGAQLLGVEPGGELGRGDEIGEERRHDLALLDSAGLRPAPTSSRRRRRSG